MAIESLQIKKFSENNTKKKKKYIYIYTHTHTHTHTHTDQDRRNLLEGSLKNGKDND